jgi:hypothetical protein
MDPHKIIGMEVPAANGGNFGHRVISYNPETEDYLVQPIRWSTGEPLDEVDTIDVHKITYRYDLTAARPSQTR